MKTHQQSPKHTPELFYMPRDTGEVLPVYDSNGVEVGTEPVIAYDLPVLQEITAQGIFYTRKSKKGIRKTHLTPYFATVYNGVDEDNLTPVMTQNITQEVSTDGGATWYVPVVTDRMVDANADGLIDFLLTTGPASYCKIDTVDNYFLENCGKQTYEISAPGNLTRLKLQVTIHDLDEALVDISDFDGPVTYDTTVNANGEDVVIYTFYPDGVEFAVIDPYLSVDDAGTTITVDWESGDSATWIVATANAYLLHSSSVRAVILEDYYMYTCYQDRLLRYHRNTATTTEGYTFTASGTKTETTISSTSNNEYYLQPCSTSVETNRTTIAAQIEGDTQTLTAGTLVTDMNLPLQKANSFGYDGALYVEMDSTPELKYNSNEARTDSSIVIPQNAKWGIRTVNDAGTGHDEHLIAYFKLDAAYSTTKILEEITNTEVGTLSGVTFTSANRGNGALFDGTTDYIYLTSAEQTTLGINYSKGSISLQYTNTNNETSGSEADLLNVTTASSNRFIFRWDYGTWNLFVKDGSGTYIDVNFTPLDGSTLVAGSKSRLHLVWDDSIPLVELWQNGQKLGIASTTAFTANTGSTITPSTLYIGNYDTSDTRFCDGQIDDLKWYNNTILPYGAYYTGIGSNSADYPAINTNVAHSDIIFAWDCESADTNIPTTPITGTLSGLITTGAKLIGTYGYDNGGGSSNKADFTVTSPTTIERGSAGFWVNPQSLGINDGLLGIFASSSEYIMIYCGGTGTIRIRYSNGTQKYTDSIALSTGVWSYIHATWDRPNAIMTLSVNGVRAGDGDITGVEATDTVSTIRVGHLPHLDTGYTLDAYFDQVFVSSDPNTPQHWTVGGKPVCLPVVSK